jgi:hypothetical protein
MKQETGSNPLNRLKEMSIRLRSDGHSFPLELPQGWDAADRVRVVVPTHQTVLIPSELLDVTHADRYLRLAGVPCSAEQVAVCGATQHGRVAVMAVERAVDAQLRQTLGAKLLYSSPLTYEPDYVDRVAWVTHVDGVLYVKLYNHTLRYAEAIEAPKSADILYFVGCLNELYPLREYPLQLQGNRVLAKQLKRFFREVQCES